MDICGNYSIEWDIKLLVLSLGGARQLEMFSFSCMSYTWSTWVKYLGIGCQFKCYNCDTDTQLFMAALWNRVGHYICVLLFLHLLFFLTAVGDWMSTILPHMMWP